MYSDICEDYRAYSKNNASFLRIVLAFLQIAGFRASVLYRLGHRHWVKKHRLRAAVYTRMIRGSCHMDIELGARIGPGICFPHTWGIVIGGKCIVGKNCRIMQGVTLGGSLGRKRPSGQSQPVIGDLVHIGPGAKVMGPINVGDRAKIGPNSVVLENVPPGISVFGIPAKNIFSLCTEIEEAE